MTTKTTAIALASAAIPTVAVFANSSSDSSPYKSRFLPNKSSPFGSISLSTKDFLKQANLGFVQKNLAAAKMEAPPSSDQKPRTQVPSFWDFLKKKNTLLVFLDFNGSSLKVDFLINFLGFSICRMALYYQSFL